MNFRALSPEQSRKMALSILAGAVVAAIALVAIPTWLWHRHYDTALADLVDRHERYQRIAATRADVTSSLEVVRAKDAKKFFLRTGAAALSAAEAQEAMRSLIEGSGGRLITMQIPPAKDEGRYRQAQQHEPPGRLVGLLLLAHQFEEQAQRREFHGLGLGRGEAQQPPDDRQQQQPGECHGRGEGQRLQEGHHAMPPKSKARLFAPPTKPWSIIRSFAGD